MTKKREDNQKPMTDPPGSRPKQRPAGTIPKSGRRGHRRSLTLTPEGIDRQFWPLWRAHVLAGIGMITGYSLGLPTISDGRSNGE